MPRPMEGTGRDFWSDSAPNPLLYGTSREPLAAGRLPAPPFRAHTTDLPMARRLLPPAAAVPLLLLGGPAAAQGLLESPISATRSFGYVTDQVLVDLNGDGRKEVVVTQYNAPGLDVVYLDSLGRPSSYDWVGLSIDGILEIVSLDLEGDGDQDLACFQRTQSSFSIEFLTNVDGELVEGLRPRLPVLFGEALDLIAYDFTGDGLDDLAVHRSSSSPGLIRYTNEGTGFDPSYVPEVMNALTAFDMVDIDGDGLDDLIILGSIAGRVVVRPGLPGGSFGLPVDVAASLTGSIPPRANFLDVDSDGDRDLLLELDLVMTVVEQVAPFTFQNPSPIATFEPSGASFTKLRVLDFNADGVDDFAIHVFDPAVSMFRSAIHLGDGTGGFSLPPTLADGGLTDERTRLADLNDDGWLDAVSQGIRRLEVLVSTSGPGVEFRTAVPLGDTLGNVSNVNLVDVDQDGDDDIVCTSRTLVSNVLLFKNEGALRFGSAKLIAEVPANSVGAYISLTHGDFDGDGAEDVLGLFDPPQGPGSLHMFKGAGDGSFSGPDVLQFVVADSTSRFLSVPEDIDGDGFLDILLGNANALASPYPLQLFANTNPGSQFTPIDVLPAGQNGYSPPAALDVNGDGLLDLVANTPSALVWIEQTAPGDFAAPVQLPPMGVSDGTPAPIAGDWNGDGFRDLLVKSSPPAVLLGSALGLSSQPVLSAPFGPPADGPHVTGDFDDDGALDLTTMGRTFQQESVLRFGDGTGQLTVSEPLPLPEHRQRTTSAVASDVDLDGDLDLVRTGSNADRVEILINRTIPSVGESRCGLAAWNSSGGPARMTAFGSATIVSTDLRLRAEGLPRNQFGFFIGSQTERVPTLVPYTAGLICLGGAIGRYVQPNQILSSGPGGRFELPLDPTQLIEGGVIVAATAGSAWSFQAWFRDFDHGSATSNFTDALRIVFE